MKVHSFGHSVFGRLLRDLLRILLGALGSEASEGLRKPAPEAGRLLPWIRVFFSTFLTKKSEIKKKEKRREEGADFLPPFFFIFFFFLVSVLKNTLIQGSRLLKDRKKHCFVNEKVFKNIRKNDVTLHILFLL